MRGDKTQWEMDDAEQQFDELLRRAIEGCPQVVTRHGEEIVVFVSASQYRGWQRDRPDREG